MELHELLRFIHITCFAAWFGTVFASMFFLKTLEPGLTGTEAQVGDKPKLLQRYIKLETKVADVSFIGVVATGIILAQFYHGWTVWALVKSGLIILQVALTMGYIVKAIQPLTYPCTRSEYKKWYNLFTISFSMFGAVLGVTFFLL